MQTTDSLSAREAEVLRLAVEGHIDDSIAQQMGISVATVRGYWLRIRSKYGFGSRSELVARFTNELNHRDNMARAEREERAIETAHLRVDEALAKERAAVDELMKRSPGKDRQALADVRAAADVALSAIRKEEAEARRNPSKDPNEP